MSTSGPNQAAAVAETDDFENAWSNVANAVTDNNSYATCGTPTNFLDFTSFGTFAGVSSGDAVSALLIELACKDDAGGGTTAWSHVELIVGGVVVGSAENPGASVSAAETYLSASRTIGQFGLGSLTGSQVNASNFGVRIKFSQNTDAATVSVDACRVTLTYAPSAPAPVLNVTGTADNGTYGFGTVPVNTGTSHQFTITNTGDATATLGTLSTTGVGWSISGADNPSGQTIAAAATKTVTVVGNFATAGSKTGYLNIPSDEVASPYVVNLTATAMSAAITGTATASITEADIVAGGKTIIITLTNDTWVAAGATFDAQRQAIINGIDSAQAEATGWDAVVKATQGVSGVVRTSNTVVTITLDAQATYNISATETITVTVPSAALTGAGGAVVASPTLTVTAASGTVGRITKINQAIRRASTF